ncbi:MAG: 50S ribosomal protein L2 [Candidatus Parcubacteria bacterium]|nr:MAG: 50S ribosomal protein L2 [Candidatus Parcubacteria bacterium]
MSIKTIKSRSSGKIIRVLVDKSAIITAQKPYKPLTVALKKRTARNSQGRITVRFRSNPYHRRLYRIIDFSRLDKKGIVGTVETIEYDPNRSAFIMLVSYLDGDKRYHLAPENIKVGDKIVCDENTSLQIGNRMALKNINSGTEIFELELVPGSGGKLIRSAGSFGVMMGIEKNYALIKMPSGEIRKIHKECYATLGRVSNSGHRLEQWGKAGRSRWQGRRPKVRGSAMNPRDHPYGGGEGKATRGTRKPKDKWGNITGGRKTRNVKKPYSKLIIKRRK